MEMAKAGLPHDIVRTPLSYRGNGIVPRIKADACEGFSPKSVINDCRIISPASSSSGSMERRIATDKHSQRQPRHDRGYSISDGESDSDTYPDSSRELAKVGVSGHLESLPETHSLALEAFNPGAPETAEESSIGYCQVNSSTSADEGRRPLLSTKYKETYAGQNFSLHSFDKELLQTMSRGGNSTAAGTVTEPLTMESNHDEKFVISGGNPQPELSNSYGYASPGYVKSASAAEVEPHKLLVRPNGTVGNRMHANRASPPRHDENSGINHTGQFRPNASPMWPDSVDVRSNGFSSHTTTNPHGIGGGKQQESTQWQRPGAPSHRPAETDEAILVQESRDSKCRDPPFLQGGWSPENGVADKTEEARRRQAGQGPYSGSMGIFAYPGTPQRSFPPSLQGIHIGSPAGGGSPVVTGSPGYERAGISHIPAQASGGRAQQRPASGLSLKPKVPKPPPSKWDDADKWIASPSHTDTPATPNFRPAQVLIQGPVTHPGKRTALAGQGMRGLHGVGSPDYANQNGEFPSSANNNGQANEGMIRNEHQQLVNPAPAKALTFSDLSSTFELPRTGTKYTESSTLQSRIDSENQTDDIPVSSHLIERSGRGDITEAFVPGVVSPKSLPENGKLEAQRDPTPSDSPVRDIISNAMQLQISKYGRSASLREVGTDIPTPRPAPGHRDMGTQMTPFPSLRNSTCNTPWLDASPTRHNTPARTDRRAVSLGAMIGSDLLELQSCHLEKLEHRNLGCEGQATLDRNSNWSTREEEEEESAKSLRQNDFGEAKKVMLLARATAWEEAEHAKFIARFYREEARIQAWEALETAKAQAQMRKVEVKLERMRADASKKMSIKLATARQKAEEMKVAAESLRDEQAAKVSQRAQQIRQSAELSSMASCFTCCFVP